LADCHGVGARGIPQKEIDEQAALGVGMKEKAEEFVTSGGEIYSLATGDLAQDLNAQTADWIWFTHNQTSNLRPDYYWQPEGSALEEFSYDLRREFARSIAIVSPTGLDKFLCFNFEEWLSE